MTHRRVPKYAFHKGTGQARVRINGKDIWLGKYGTPESMERYAKAVADWQQTAVEQPEQVTFGQLAMLYKQHAKKHYRKNGKVTTEYGLVCYALKWMNQVARKVQLAEITPRHLKMAKENMIESGMTRGTVNKFLQRIRRAVKWAVGEELCHASVLVGLQAVPDVKRGRTKAIDHEPVKPVPEAFIEAVEPHVPSGIWGVVQFQLHTGARPGEALILRACDIDMSGDVWIYRPETHKTQHHGKERVICIGPVAQKLLQQFLTTDLNAYLFAPTKGRNRHYRRDSYTNWIRRACERAEVPHWSPNRLRHNFATKARKTFGIEATRVTLGHSSAVTSEIYAERDLEAAQSVVARIG
ncbi:MAG: tyrosine-type recombinase/integrase [Planctomycetaceae bacterium]